MVLPPRILIALLPLVLGSVFVFAPTSVYGETDEFTEAEYKVKAAFLLNFLRFIDFPNITGDYITVCVYGSIPQPAFESIRGRVIAGREIRTVFKPTGEDLGQCRVVFLSRTVDKELGRFLGQARGRGVLTVGEVENF